MDRGYVLHSYPYRETSLILQAWTEKHGRLGLVAKGARRPKSASRSVLIPFQPLALDWFGRGELRTLKSAEPAAPATPLAGASLLSAFYLNELLLKLTTRDDPHEGLFAAYDEAITSLRAISREARTVQREAGTAQRDIEPVLRRFELRLLQELGYAVELLREAGTHAPIAAEREYLYVVERGPVPAPEGETPSNAVRLAGQTLIDLERGDFASATTAAQSKQLMRLLIHHSLNGQELATRSLVRDLQRIEGEAGEAQ
ncbi:MAG TPA: DNA repair protein RecO [Usitatibacter sp.]|jgi:DNA repair protein RecO (recombination protein O)|nr:DNA repair protein RecO [Usitatibacter sp.]